MEVYKIKIIMKKLLFILALICSLQVHAQKLIGGNNIIKGNLTSFALKNYQLTYERSLNRFMSLTASYRYMPKGGLPLQSTVKKYIDNSDINYDLFQMGNNALTFESRFYLGLQKMSGFYIAPYARFGNMEVDIPVNYTYTTQPSVVNGVTVPSTTVKTKANLNGSIRSQSVGAYFGMQFQLLTKVVLDIWAIGGHYGSSNGTIEAVLPAGTPSEAGTALKATLDQTNASPFKLSTTVAGNRIITNTDGPWAGLRGAGITVGLRF
jgi:hypothetical protein